MPRGKPFVKGGDPRRNNGGQRNKAAVAFSRTLRQLIVQEGEKSLALDGKRYKKVALMVRKVWHEALNGKEWAVLFIAERTEGKVTDKWDVTTHGDLDVFNHEVITGLLAGRPSGNHPASRASESGDSGA